MLTSRIFFIIGALALSLALPYVANVHGHAVAPAAQNGDCAQGAAEGDGATGANFNHGACCVLFSCVPATLRDPVALGPSLAAMARTFSNIVVPLAGPTPSIISPPG